MKQYYKEYYYWEDYINGMYEMPTPQEAEKLVSLAIDVLTNKETFFSLCKYVINQWPISSKVNLTNKSCNRKAWLGQACCNIRYKVPELCTRVAWGRLSLIQQNEANEIAKKIIDSFELNYEKKDRELY